MTPRPGRKSPIVLASLWPWLPPFAALPRIEYPRAHLECTSSRAWHEPAAQHLRILGDLAWVEG